jgi:hypothetical protein
VQSSQRPVTPDEDFRVLTELQTARSKLFHARKVVLAEGLTEKLVLPYVSAALGGMRGDLDDRVRRQGESSLLARNFAAVGIPFLAFT